MTTCPECGSVAPESFGECPTCGGRLTQGLEAEPVEACARCGEQISSGAEACPACGDLRGSQQCDQHGDRQAEGQCVICGKAVCDSCNQGSDIAFLCAEHADI